jgi:GAF domain-containing protein
MEPPSVSNSSKREVRVGSLFLRLAEMLDEGFDLSDYLQMLVDETKGLLPADEVGLFLADAQGNLRVAAATTPDARAVETLVLEAGASPCLHSFSTGAAVGVHDIRDTVGARAGFARVLDAADFRSVYSVPMRVRRDTIGVISLFSRYPYTPSEVDAGIADALARAAATAIVQARASSAHLILTEQLQQALTSRICIEQAKGVIAQTRQIGMDDAFALIRDQARRNSESLQSISQRIIDRTLTV